MVPDLWNGDQSRPRIAAVSETFIYWKMSSKVGFYGTTAAEQCDTKGVGLLYVSWLDLAWVGEHRLYVCCFEGGGGKEVPLWMVLSTSRSTLHRADREVVFQYIHCYICILMDSVNQFTRRRFVASFCCLCGWFCFFVWRQNGYARLAYSCGPRWSVVVTTLTEYDVKERTVCCCSVVHISFDRPFKSRKLSCWLSCFQSERGDGSGLRLSR